MKIQVMNVTPKMAAHWLRKNQSNRPLRSAYVRSLADAMKRGEWAVTHQPIAINGEKLIDGQHRLGAVIESGLPQVKMTVAFDADTATFDTIDIGIRRSLSDIYKEDRHVMNPISFIGRLIFHKHITPRELHPIYEKFAEPMREFVALVNRGTPRFTAAPIKVAAVARILQGESKEYVQQLYKNMCTFRLEKLPRVAQIFVKQISLEPGAPAGVKKIMTTERDQLLVRSWIVFGRENSDLERVMVRDPSDRKAEITAIYKNALGMK